jgi:hypothetical protein
MFGDTKSVLYLDGWDGVGRGKSDTNPTFKHFPCYPEFIRFKILPKIYYPKLTHSSWNFVAMNYYLKFFHFWQ